MSYRDDYRDPYEPPDEPPTNPKPMSEQENAYIHFRDTGEFLTGEPIASKAMSDQDKARKLAEEKDAETIALKLGCHAGLSYGEQRLLVADIKQALLQFAQEREGDCAERCNCEDSWPSYSQYPKPSCPIHSKKGAKDE